jgi:hypothetical protein
MIPLPAAVRAKIQAWLPHVLAGYDYPVIETDNIVPNLTAPAITYHVGVVGMPSLESNTILRTVRNADGTLDDVWGQYHYATMSVVLRANTDTEMGLMWETFIRKCLSTRRDLLLRIDGVRFVEILDSKHLDPERLPGGKNLYWSQVDLRFEYEVSDISEAEYIRTAYTDLSVETVEPASHLYFERGEGDRERAIGIVAYIVDNN